MEGTNCVSLDFFNLIGVTLYWRILAFKFYLFFRNKKGNKIEKISKKELFSGIAFICDFILISSIFLINLYKIILLAMPIPIIFIVTRMLSALSFKIGSKIFVQIVLATVLFVISFSMLYGMLDALGLGLCYVAIVLFLLYKEKMMSKKTLKKKIEPNTQLHIKKNLLLYKEKLKPSNLKVKKKETKPKQEKLEKNNN